VPADVLQEAQGYYWDSLDMERVGRDALRFKLFAPTLYEPAMAPEGEQILIVQKVLEIEYESIRDWTRHKQEIENFIFTNLERVLPGLGKHIVVKTSASARTSWRFTLNHRGAMLGWEMSPDQLGEGRPTPETAIANLYCVGHWTQPGGGITPVIVSAQRVAQAILAGRPA
jgi:prolycopene isomerase